MGLLDDLKSEAEKLQKQHSSEEELRAQQEARYQQEIKPKLHLISSYFSELCEQLNILKPDTGPVYTIPGYQKVTGFVQQNYSINADSMDNMKQLRLRFNAMLPNDIEFSVSPKSSADETRSFLDHQNFTFSEWPVRDNHQRVVGLTFQVKLKVEIMFLFRADMENGRIEVVMVNFDGFGVKSKVYRPESIDEAWLEDMGRYLLRKSDTLHSLEISDAAKEQLRIKLKKEEERRTKELKERLAQDELERQQNENKFVKLFKKKLMGK